MRGTQLMAWKAMGSACGRSSSRSAYARGLSKGAGAGAASVSVGVAVAEALAAAAAADDEVQGGQQQQLLLPRETTEEPMFGAGAGVVGLKLLALVLVVLISLIGSFLPLRLSSLSDSHRHVVMEQCRFFTAGVFLGVGLLHMLPEAVEGFQLLTAASAPARARAPTLAASSLSDAPTHAPVPVRGSSWEDFPLAYAICAMGFVLVWFVEKRVLSAPIERGQAPHIHAPRGGPSTAIPGVEVGPGGGGGQAARAALVASDCDLHRMVALAAGAESQGGASLCVVKVSSVASYGPHSCHPLPECPHQQQLQQHPAPGVHPAPGARAPARGDACALCKGALSALPAATEHGAHDRGLEAAGEGEWPHPHSPHKEDMDMAHRGSFAHEERAALLAGGGGGSNCVGERQRWAEGRAQGEGRHQWGASQPWSGVVGGTPEDSCAGLHQHTHAAQHHHIVLHGRGAISVLLAVLFSLHSFVVGAALGTETHWSGAVSLIIAVIAHKGAEAFAVGVQFVKEGVPVRKMAVVMLIYCAMTPAGILLGMAAGLVGGPAGALLATTTQAFGAGTVLYIVMMELSDNSSTSIPGWSQLALVLAGLGLMAAVSVFV